MTNTKDQTKSTTKRIPKKVHTEPLELPGEEWRDLPNFPGYKVSNLGRIKSYKRFNKYGGGYILRPQIMKKKRYRFVFLTRPDSTTCFMLVHRAVASAFIPKTDEKANKIMHRDYNVNNNSVSNLKWIR